MWPIEYLSLSHGVSDLRYLIGWEDINNIHITFSLREGVHQVVLDLLSKQSGRNLFHV